MAKLVDLTGKRIGRLTVISRAFNDSNGKPAWNCVCDCGTECVKSSSALIGGFTKSCGCWRKEYSAAQHTKHNGCKRGQRDRLYSVWNMMKQRCGNPNNDAYEHYGGRGISVCDEWKNDYETFRSWAIENGYDPHSDRHHSCTIDRIDVNGNYEPNNCRWVSAEIQANNSRRNHTIDAFGRTQTLAEWGKETGVKPSTIAFRLRSGWDTETALTLMPQIGRNQTWREHYEQF